MTGVASARRRPFPDYSSYHYPEENDEDAKFRHACTSGDVAEAEKLVKLHGTELVTKAHWHGNTPIFEVPARQKNSCKITPLICSYFLLFFLILTKIVMT